MNDKACNKVTFPTRRAILLGGVGLVCAGSGYSRCRAEDFKDVPWLDEIQRRPKTMPTDAPRLPGLVDRATKKPFATREEWEIERTRIREDWLNFLGPLSRIEREKPMLQIMSEDRLDGVIRQLVRYKVENGQTVEAYLLRPRKNEGRRPAVAVFHSTVDHSLLQPAGIEGRPALAFGLELARRGHVTICPRNYLWPETRRLDADGEAKKFQQRNPDSKGMARMLHDAMTAVDILAAQPYVDANRIGAVGHSLGAKEVLYLAAFDSRMRATVSSEGGIGTRFSNWDAPWYLGETIQSKDFQHEHHELLALVAPRAFLLVGGESADGDQSSPFIEAALPIYRLYSDQIPRPRIGLLNHRGGHAVPQEVEQRIYQWLETYL